tara:strand:+ start:4699 stop:5217 length:519 start_codon:yes stop_codon:yes gene_type:complete
MALTDKKKEDRLATPLREVKSYLKENYNQTKGCKCPACGQNVKLYKRKLNSSMAYAVIIMYRLQKNSSIPNQYFKMNEEIAKLKIPSSNIEYPKLYYWGLVEEKPKDTANTKIKTSGYWRLTPLGVKFALNEITVPKYVFVYNNHKEGVSDEWTTINKSLGDKFNYFELMNS